MFSFLDTRFSSLPYVSVPNITDGAKRIQGNLLFSRAKGQACLLPLLSCIYSSPQEHALRLFSGQSFLGGMHV